MSTTPNRFLALMLLAAVLAVPAWAQSADPRTALAIGASIPADMSARQMPGTDGRQQSIQGAMGPQGVAVIFWSASCPWVRRYEERVITLAREYQRAGINFIAVNSNDPVAYPADNLHAMQRRAQEAAYPFPYVIDEGSRLAIALGASRTPQVFLFASNGRLVYEGAIDDSAADPARVEAQFLRDAMNAHVASPAGGANVQKTTAFGCLIKDYP
jgi:thiol-disulfide isomerase/thioredoxin